MASRKQKPKPTTGGRGTHTREEEARRQNRRQEGEVRGRRVGIREVMRRARRAGKGFWPGGTSGIATGVLSPLEPRSPVSRPPARTSHTPICRAPGYQPLTNHPIALVWQCCRLPSPPNRIADAVRCKEKHHEQMFAILFFVGFKCSTCGDMCLSSSRQETMEFPDIAGPSRARRMGPSEGPWFAIFPFDVRGRWTCHRVGGSSSPLPPPARSSGMLSWFRNVVIRGVMMQPCTPTACKSHGNRKGPGSVGMRAAS
ncbi:hypothetical protein QBC39DRAFT_37714 [Podospora conica]|nr:hypothetical protein QBC39DRAFT_37714 [Schizothecium conicum]